MKAASMPTVCSKHLSRKSECIVVWETLCKIKVVIMYKIYMPIARSFPTQAEGSMAPQVLHLFVTEFMYCHNEKDALWTSLTNHEAQQFVRQDAGGDESHPQADVKFLGALWLHPHEQTETQTAGGGQNTHQYISYVYFLHTWLSGWNKTTHFFIFSKTSAIFPKRFWKRFKSTSLKSLSCFEQRLDR